MPRAPKPKPTLEELAARYIQMWETNRRKHRKEIAAIGKELADQVGDFQAYILINQAKEAWLMLGGPSDKDKSTGPTVRRGARSPVYNNHRWSRTHERR